MSDKPLFKRAAVIGVGLIGGSIARVLKNRGLAEKVVGAGRSRENLETALRLGVINDIASPEEAADDADFIILCTPVLSTVPTLEKIASHIKPGALVTDAGSTKNEIVKAAQKIAGESFVFIGSHPVAGTEKSGAESSFEKLFEGHKCIVTPTAGTPAGVLEKLKSVWQAAGMEVVEMDPETHDRVMSAVSHLPHMAAYALVNTVCDENRADELIKFAAGGFKDFTRIAASSPEMWADIAVANSKALTELIGKMKTQLDVIESAINEKNRKKLLEIFKKSKNFREGLK